MEFNMVYWVGFVLTSFLSMVVVFVYESTKRADILDEGVFVNVIVSLVIAMCWFIVVPIAILVGMSYVVAKLLIFCREKWRNK